MNIVELVHQSRNVIEIGNSTLAIFPCLKIHDGGCRTACASVDALATDLDIVAGIDAMQCEGAPRAGNYIFNKAARKMQAAFVIHSASGCHGASFKAGRDLRQAKLLKQLQRQVMDPQNLMISQRLVPATHHAGGDGRNFL